MPQSIAMSHLPEIQYRAALSRTLLSGRTYHIGMFSLPIEQLIAEISARMIESWGESTLNNIKSFQRFKFRILEYHCSFNEQWYSKFENFVLAFVPFTQVWVYR